MDNSEVKFALRKLIGAIGKPIAIILAFLALVLFLMRAISNMSAN